MRRSIDGCAGCILSRILIYMWLNLRVALNLCGFFFLNYRTFIKNVCCWKAASQKSKLPVLILFFFFNLFLKDAVQVQSYKCILISIVKAYGLFFLLLLPELLLIFRQQSCNVHNNIYVNGLLAVRGWFSMKCHLN